MLQNIYISDKCCSSELSRKKKPEKFYSAVFNIIVIIIIHVFWAENHNIWMSSEGSCDWINEAANSSLITGINYMLKYIQIESCYFIYIYIYMRVCSGGGLPLPKKSYQIYSTKKILSQSSLGHSYAQFSSNPNQTPDPANQGFQDY